MSGKKGLMMDESFTKNCLHGNPSPGIAHSEKKLLQAARSALKAGRISCD